MGIGTKQPQGWVPLGLGLLLWGTSAILTFVLFFWLAGEAWWAKAVAGSWAIGLEGTKILSWRFGGRYRLLAVCLVGLTLFSAWGLAVSSVEGQLDHRDQTIQRIDEQHRDTRRSVDSLNRQLETLVARLDRLPPEYVSAAERLNQEIRSIRELLRQEVIHESDPSVHAAGPPGDDPFTILAAAIGWSRGTVVVLVLLIVAGLTEISALTMAGYRPPQGVSESMVAPQPSAPPSPDDYLRAALDHPKAPRLLGRLEVAKRLGLNENQARVLLQQLIDTGRVRRGTKAFEAGGTATKPLKPQATS